MVTSMKKLIAFDLDGTLALIEAAADDRMAKALADLLDVVQGRDDLGRRLAAVREAGRRPPARRAPTWRKLFIHADDGHQAVHAIVDGAWTAVYAELFDDETSASNHRRVRRRRCEATGFDQSKTWGERIEDRGSQITFSALGQQAPLEAKEQLGPRLRQAQDDRRPICAKRLPGLSINMGGATSIDITREGVDKAYGLKKLRDASGIALDEDDVHRRRDLPGRQRLSGEGDGARHGPRARSAGDECGDRGDRRLLEVNAAPRHQAGATVPFRRRSR